MSLHRNTRVSLAIATATIVGVGVLPTAHADPTSRPSSAAQLQTGVQAAAPSGLQVTSMEHSVSAKALAQNLAGSGVTVSNVHYTGASAAAGTFSGGSGVVGFGSGIVLSSGAVQTDGTHSDSCAHGVEGPNQCQENSTYNNLSGDPDLTTLAGYDTYDATVLSFDFVPAQSKLKFNYVFSSDEYPEYANTEYNDVFGFYVNGTNCAVVPGTDDPVSVDTINGGNPLGTDAKNPQYYVDNHFNSDGSPSKINTEMDGLTTVLSCTASVEPGKVNHMKLAIADGSDYILDSNVFLQAQSLVSGTQVSTTLSGGGESGQSITVPAGTPVTDSATLTGTASADATGTVTYAAYTDDKCTENAVPAGTVPVADGQVPASDPLTLDPGTYYWKASYSGDANNSAASSCDEVLTVEAASPTSSPSSSTSTTPPSSPSGTPSAPSSTAPSASPTSSPSSSPSSSAPAVDPTSTTTGPPIVTDGPTDGSGPGGLIWTMLGGLAVAGGVTVAGSRLRRRRN